MIRHLKSYFRKYAPLGLQPYAYEAYAWSTKVLSGSSGKMVKALRSKEFQSILSSNTVQILQPTFYDTDGKYYFSGGAERYLNDLAEIIIEMGYTPYIVQMANRYWHRKYNKLNVFGVPSGKSFKSLSKLAHHPAFGKPKIRIYSPFALALSKEMHNSIGISHGIFWDKPYEIHRLPLIRKSFANLKIFVSVDTSTISWCRGSLQKLVTGKDMRYIPNYVDLESFKPAIRKDDGTIRIIYPRNLCEARGYFLVEALIPDILIKYPQVEFHFVGFSGDEEIIKRSLELVKKFDKKVFVYQEVDKDMPKVYQKADIVLIPTVCSEGTSLSCLEAMATGNAIIASNVGGLPDLIIDGYNGLMISPNVVQLKEALEKLITNTDLRKQLGQNALQVAKVFDKKIWQARWRKVLRSVLPINIA